MDNDIVNHRNKVKDNRYHMEAENGYRVRLGKKYKESYPLCGR